MKDYITLKLDIAPKVFKLKKKTKKSALDMIPRMLIYQLQQQIFEKQAYIVPCDSVSIKKNKTKVKLTAKWEILDIPEIKMGIDRIIGIAEMWFCDFKKMETHHLTKMFNEAITTSEIS